MSRAHAPPPPQGVGKYHFLFRNGEDGAASFFLKWKQINDALAANRAPQDPGRLGWTPPPVAVRERKSLKMSSLGPIMSEVFLLTNVCNGWP